MPSPVPTALPMGYVNLASPAGWCCVPIPRARWLGDRPWLMGHALALSEAPDTSDPQHREMPSLVIPWQTSSCVVPHSSIIMKMFFIAHQGLILSLLMRTDIFRFSTNRCGKNRLVWKNSSFIGAPGNREGQGRLVIRNRVPHVCWRRH